MKVSKWVDMGQEVEVEIGAEDIREALSEEFRKVTDDRLGEPGPNCIEVHRALNDMAAFLNALTDEQISALTIPARRMVRTFLAKAAERFEPIQEAK